MNDSYSPCTCGSGKKFKWCCQPIHEKVSEVYAMDEQGQHEAALRAMDEIVAAHPDNAEAWGRKAQLLFQNEKPAEAEQTLEKAFELFPNYPFGYFLKSRFRLYEGEITGALLLLRKAAEFYDPNSHDILAQIYIEIFDCEMKLNHPIAGRAAAEVALRHAPANEELKQGLVAVFGNQNPNLPRFARVKFVFQGVPEGVERDRRDAWAKALQTGTSGKLSDVLKALEELTKGDNVEPAAWFNLGLTHAWLGNNVAAIEALERFVEGEPNEAMASQAWAIAEVLRFGLGLEDQCDTVEHSIAFGVRDPRAFVAELGELERAGLLSGARVNQEEGILSAIILEPPGPALTPEMVAKQNLKPAAYVALMSNFVRLWHTNLDSLQSVYDRFKEKLGDLIVHPQAARGPAKFLESLSDGIRFPRQVASQEEAQQRMREGFENYYEEVWINRPLKSLSGVPPIDAVGSPTLRKKLRGVILFLTDCSATARYPYDFNRLMRKLGLAEATPATPAAEPTTGAEAPAAPAPAPEKLDISSMGAAELAALNAESLSSADLDQAFQAATKLDAKEIAGKFAAMLVERPPYPERPDRYPLHQFLINQAVANSNLDAAMDHVNAGEADDCKNNEGKRRNEYELRRAQLHAKRGEFDDAERVFDALIARMPTEMNYRVNAAETMISARQGKKAEKYAKDGLAAAVKANNRDLEGHFKELLAAAQRK